MEQTAERPMRPSTKAAKRLNRRRKALALPRPTPMRTLVEQPEQASEGHLRTFMSNAPIIFFTLDHNGIFTLSEGQGLQALGLEPGQLVGASAFEVYRDFPETLDHIRRALAGEKLTTIDHLDTLIFEMQFTPLYNTTGQMSSVVGVATDIRERVQAEETLKVHERHFRALTEQASDLVFILDPVGMYRYVSPSHQRIMGYAPDELIGTNVFSLLHPEDLAQALTTFAGAFQTSGTMLRLECRIRHADGSWLTLECVGNNCLDDPTIEGVIVNARDVTERTAMEEMLRHQALHDGLTNLPNRTSLQQRLEEAIGAAERTQSEMALLIMDLNRFKDINDSFGHQYGDLLLQEVGTRLCQALSSSDTIARLGGDEFAVLLPTADETDARHVAEEIRTLLEEPFIIADQPLQIEASIGVVVYPAHGSDPLTLMRHADVAMYAAKQAHEGYILYDSSHDQFSTRRLALIGALRHAITTNELRLYYQPKANVKTGIIQSAEALLRWQHPTLGFIPPDQFIPLAEQTGLITPLTQWVLETAIQQCKHWREAGLDMRVAVNLSTWNLRERTLPEIIGALFERYNVPAHCLRFEVTESAVMLDVNRALDVLHRIAALGSSLSVDDFGTGYSSLAYLKRLPVDELKIDRSFVQHMTEVEADATIVRSTITLAHSLGMAVVAEGVEDQATWKLLDTLDCDKIQGYYLSRPLATQDFEQWLLQR